MKRRTRQRIATALIASSALGLFGCGEAKQVSAEARPSASASATIVRVESTVSPKDKAEVEAIIGRASLLNMMPSNVTFLNDGETFTCEDKPGFTATSADLIFQYCNVNRTGIVTAAQVNETISQFGKTDVDREAARNYAVAMGFAMKMGADEAVNPGKTEREKRVLYSCFAGLAVKFLNAPEGQVIVNNLAGVPGYGYDAAKAFLHGANEGGCALYGLKEYGTPDNSLVPPSVPVSPLPLPTNS